MSLNLRWSSKPWQDSHRQSSVGGGPGETTSLPRGRGSAETGPEEAPQRGREPVQVFPH